MTCDQLLKAMNEYVDGHIDPAVCSEFEQHLAGCNPCQIVVDNIRKTITLYRDGERFEMPVEFRLRLHQRLAEHWRNSIGPSPSQMS